jgi:hypothetical protein
MRNVYQVLKDNERELERVSREVEALRLVAPLLADEADGSARVVAHVAETGFVKVAPTPQVPAVSWP